MFIHLLTGIRATANMTAQAETDIAEGRCIIAAPSTAGIAERAIPASIENIRGASCFTGTVSLVHSRFGLLRLNTSPSEVTSRIFAAAAIIISAAVTGEMRKAAEKRISDITADGSVAVKANLIFALSISDVFTGIVRRIQSDLPSSEIDDAVISPIEQIKHTAVSTIPGIISLEGMAVSA